MRIITYNINGIRAALKKGFVDWISLLILILFVYIKAREDQFDSTVFKNLGYQSYWFWLKPGYSGTAIICKKKPINITYGMSHKDYDYEGRVMRVDFETYSIISVYMPSGSSGELRQSFKMAFLKTFKLHC